MRRDSQKPDNVIDGFLAGGGYRLGCLRSGFVPHRLQLRGRLLQIGRVAAGAVDDHVLAGLGQHHEFMRLAAAHHAAAGLDHLIPESAALIDAAIEVIVLAIAPIQPLPVDIEGVGILHGELAHPKQPRFGSRLVPELGLYLVPDLGQLAIGAELIAGDGCKNLLMGHAQAHVPVGAVLETKHVRPHALPTAAFLPDFSRVQGRQGKFLGAHAIELVPDDPGDLEHHPLGQRQKGINSRGQLPNVSAAKEQDMARHLGLGRGLPQGGDEALTPAHSDSSKGDRK